MRIGVDAKRAVRNNTGLGNYSRLVMEAVARVQPEMELVAYTPDMRQNPRLAPLLDLPNIEWRLPEPGETPVGKSAWRTFGITRCLAKDNIDLYHGLSNELPLNIRSAGIPTVVTVHDVIWRRLPYCYKAADRLLYDYKYGRSSRNATRVVAVSERTKSDVVEFYGVDPDKIDVIYQGCDASFKRPHTQEEIEKAKETYGICGRYIIQVGTIERRKNLDLTVRALTALPGDVSLVAVGRDNRWLDRVKTVATSVGVADRIIYLHNVPFSDIPLLNAGAAAAAYPSRYEGFGIPVIEAIESGVPVVAAKGSCLEEAGGPGALYVDPDSPREMAEALRFFLENPGAAASAVAAGRDHTSRFDTSRMASSLTDVYARAISRFQGCR